MSRFLLAPLAIAALVTCMGRASGDSFDDILAGFRTGKDEGISKAKSALTLLNVDENMALRIVAAAGENFPKEDTLESVNALLLERLERISVDPPFNEIVAVYDRLEGKKKARETALRIIAAPKTGKGRATFLGLLERASSRDVDLSEAFRPYDSDPEEALKLYPKLLEIVPFLDERVVIFLDCLGHLDKGRLDADKYPEAMKILCARLDFLVRKRGPRISEVYGSLPVRQISWEERKKLPMDARRGHDELEILLDLAGHLHQPEIDALLDEATHLKAPTLQIFAIGSQVKRGKTPEPALLETLAAKPSERSLLRQVLTSRGGIKFYPERFNNQRDIAEADMVSWLEFGTELGMTPAKIELVKVAEYKLAKTGELRRVYVYKFPGWDGENGEWYLGWAGSFPADDKEFTSDGMTFSDFTKLSEKDAETQIKELIESLKGK